MQTAQVCVNGNTVTIQDENFRKFDGKQIFVTYSVQESKRKTIDFDSYVIPSERANFAQEYVQELRRNDRF